MSGKLHGWNGLILALTVVLSLNGCVKEKPEVVPSSLSEEQAMSLLRSGIQLHDQGRYDEAIGVYKDLLAKDPANSMAMYEMAYTYYALGEMEKAVEMCDRGLKVTDNDGDLYELKGNILDDMGRSQEAVKCYRKALMTSGRPYLVYYNMGYALVRMEKYEDAEDAFKHAAVLNPKHPTSQMMLAKLWASDRMQIQSIFAYVHFLVLEPVSPRAGQAARELVTVLNTGVEKTEKGTNITLNPNIFLEKKNAYGSLSMMLSLRSALAVTKEEIAGSTDMQRMGYQLAGLFASMAERDAEADDFAWKYYSEYYRQAAERDLVNAMCAVVLESLYPKECQAWQESHPDEMLAFRKWDNNFRFPGEEIL